MYPSKKAQQAIEFIFIFLFILTVVSLLMYFVGLITLDFQEKQYENEKDNFAQNILNEFVIMQKVEQGYERTILVSQSNDQRFEFNFTPNYLIVTDTEQGDLQPKYYELLGDFEIEILRTNSSGVNETYIRFKKKLVKQVNILDLSSHQSFSLPVCTSGPNGFFSGDGSIGVPFQICNCLQLQHVGDLPYVTGDNYFELVSNIDCSETLNWNSGEGFDPIGDVVLRFNGQLNGNSRQISNLFINRSTEGDVGMFRRTQGATISNLEVMSFDIVGNNNVGGLIGTSLSTIISNITAQGTVRGNNYIGGLVGFLGFPSIVTKSNTDINVSGNIYVGGLAGQSSTATIEFSSSLGNISATGLAGGLVGRSSSSQVRNSSFNGRVLSSGDSTAGLIGFSQNSHIINSSAFGIINASLEFNIGGLVGRSVSSEINNSFFEGTVIANNDLGGLVGHAEGTSIDSSYSKGEVLGGSEAGGLVGDLRLNSVINNSYSLSNVTANGFIAGAGFVGSTSGVTRIENSYSTGLVTTVGSSGGFIAFPITAPTLVSVYYDLDTSGRSDTGKGEPKTSVQLRTPVTNSGIYVNWSLSNWNFGAVTDYPTLTWE